MLSVNVIKESSEIIIECVPMFFSSARWEYGALIVWSLPSWQAH